MKNTSPDSIQTNINTHYVTALSSIVKRTVARTGRAALSPLIAFSGTIMFAAQKSR
jgi:hypothetical protein